MEPWWLGMLMWTWTWPWKKSSEISEMIKIPVRIQFGLNKFVGWTLHPILPESTISTSPGTKASASMCLKNREPPNKSLEMVDWCRELNGKKGPFIDPTWIFVIERKQLQWFTQASCPLEYSQPFNHQCDSICWRRTKPETALKRCTFSFKGCI